MYTGQLVFSQVMEHSPMRTFRQCIRRYQGNRYIKSFTCHDQFLRMAFAQLTHRESLRDIEVCLRSHRSKLYPMGIRGSVSRSTLAHANKVQASIVTQGCPGIRSGCATARPLRIASSCVEPSTEPRLLWSTPLGAPRSPAQSRRRRSPGSAPQALEPAPEVRPVLAPKQGVDDLFVAHARQLPCIERELDPGNSP